MTKNWTNDIAIWSHFRQNPRLQDVVTKGLMEQTQLVIDMNKNLTRGQMDISLEEDEDEEL